MQDGGTDGSAVQSDDSAAPAQNDSQASSASADPPASSSLPPTDQGATPLAPPPTAVDFEETDAAATTEDPVPPRERFAFDDNWTVAVTSVDLDAADAVLAYDSINPPPPPGTNYVAVSIAGTYAGDDVAQPAFDFSMIAEGEEHLPSIPGCGLLPESIYDVGDLAPDSTFAAQVCIAVPTADAVDGLLLRFTPPDGDDRFFELTST